MVSTLPSCGIRFSEMSIFPMIFILVTRAECVDFAGDITSFSSPSTLYLILTFFSNGSICISLAFERTAWLIIVFTSLTIGAFIISSSSISSSIS